VRWILPVCAAVLVSTAAAGGAASPEIEAAARGGYLLHASGCVACHTDDKGGGPALAGGRALETTIGTFHSPNITPDPETGLGRWDEEDFLQALGEGHGPEGRPYYPAFPYPSYTGMTAADMRDLWAHLRSLPPVARTNRAHDLDFPFGLRVLAGLWQWLYLEPGPFEADSARDDTWNRGAYLVRHLGHCGECHSPRGWLGAADHGRELAGNPEGPDGKKVPNITPHEKAGIGGWSRTDVTFYLKTGILPDGDVTGGAMEDVIRGGTSRLTDDDRTAIAVYLGSLPALAGP
jgi:mono/diheme cytochrome c family protein